MKITQRLLERKFYISAIVWTITITALSLLSLQQLPSISIIKFKDKIIHFMFYFVFVFLWCKAFNATIKKSIVIVFVAIVYGIIIEALQDALTTNRVADVYDALTNTLGAVTAALFLRLKNYL